VKIFVKKDPLRVAARLARRHVARAAWADAGTRMPPPATPACGVYKENNMPPSTMAAGPTACMHACVTNSTRKIACRHLQWRQGPLHCEFLCARPHAGVAGGGTLMPASAQAARATCRLVSRAATHRGSFLTNFFTGGLF
jgi:hypothetical protein